MIIAKVYSSGDIIGAGIWCGGKHYLEDSPEQYVRISKDNVSSEEITYYHADEKGVYFIEYQDNGNGWEPVYDSREGVDRSKEYPLPDWMFNNSPIPDYEHTYKNGEVNSRFKGYIE